MLTNSLVLCIASNDNAYIVATDEAAVKGKQLENLEIHF